MDAKKRTRKRDKFNISLVMKETVEGHSTAGGGSDVFQQKIYNALLWTQRNWIEDSNHREYYTIDGKRDHFDLSTIKGTMSRYDRGSPMWLNRNTKEWPRTWFGSRMYQTGQQQIPGQGDWGRTTSGGAQIYDPTRESGITNGGIINPIYGSFPARSVMSFDALNPKAWRRYQPLNPKLSTSQFLGELRELPRVPFLLFEKAKFFRSLSSEYLNWEFGWRPFVKDLISFVQELTNFDKRYQQLVADNGKPVRRSGPIFNQIDTSTEVFRALGQWGDLNFPVLNSWHYPDIGKKSSATRTFTTEQKYWFSGRFRYYLAPVQSVRYIEQMHRIVYGLDLTPRLLYELFPWSWLLNWATSVGDSIANMTESILDGLVADYAYTMGHYRFVTEYNSDSLLTQCKYLETKEIKARVQATPYGFGLNPNTFTGRQKAILAALLLARS